MPCRERGDLQVLKHGFNIRGNMARNFSDTFCPPFAPCPPLSPILLYSLHIPWLLSCPMFTSLAAPPSHPSISSVSAHLCFVWSTSCLCTMAAFWNIGSLKLIMTFYSYHDDELVLVSFTVLWHVDIYLNLFRYCTDNTYRCM